jgi:hypothetical protein
MYSQNIFYNRRITKIFDLKGSLRGRFAAQVQSAKDGTQPETPAHSEASSRPRKRGSEHGSDSGFPKLDGDSEGGNDGNNGKAGSGENGEATGTLLDGDFLDFTAGRPMPMDDRAKAVFHMSILNVSVLPCCSQTDDAIEDLTSPLLYRISRILCSSPSSTSLIIPFWLVLTRTPWNWLSE